MKQNNASERGQAIACPACDLPEVAVREERRESHTIRGVSVEVDCIIRRCTACNEEFDYSGDPDWRDEAFRKYRAHANLLQPEQIREWREGLGLTQAEVTKLLGWGEITLGRYETGSLQTAAHDRQLRALMAPAELLDRLLKSPDAVAGAKRFRLIDRLRQDAIREHLEDAVVLAAYQREPDAMNGHRTLDLNRLLATVLVLADGGELKTKFNKLMFYADFTHFWRHGQGITGLHYARLPHGPVPDDYQALIAALSNTGALGIREIDFGDGLVGEDLVALTEPDTSVLTPEERETLARVKRHFRDWGSKRISDISHQEPAWRETEHGRWISYDYADRLRVRID